MNRTTQREALPGSSRKRFDREAKMATDQALLSHQRTMAQRAIVDPSSPTDRLTAAVDNLIAIADRLADQPDHPTRRGGIISDCYATAIQLLFIAHRVRRL